MQTILRYLTLSPFLYFLLLGCQDELTEVSDPPAEAVLTNQSGVAELVQRTAQRDGSDDNVIDSASCISLELPLTVVANGFEIIISSEEGLRVVEEIFEEFDDDDDILEILFPITVILPDHSEQVIQNADQLEDLARQCTGDNDDDIECVDFVYPITLSVFNTETQVNEVITINNDRELYQFFDALDDDDLVGFEFPINLATRDGDTIVINNNDQLEDVLEDAIDDCDEGDDDDGDDDNDGDNDLPFDGITCGYGTDNCLQSSGVLATQARNLAAFDEIEVSACGATVVLTQGPQQTVSVTAPNNFLPFIKTEVDDDDELEIFVDIDDSCLQFDEGDSILVEISLPDVEYLTAMSGSGFEVRGTWTDIDDLEIDLSSGARTVIVDPWTAGKLDLDCSSGANYAGFNLTVDDCDVDMSSGAIAEVTVNNALSGSVSSDAILYYKGNPNISVDISGISGGQLIDAN